MTRKTPKPQLKGGLRPSLEDLQWLRLLDMKTRETVPDFNLSRLIALGLIERKGDRLVVTARGREEISKGR